MNLSLIIDSLPLLLQGFGVTLQLFLATTVFSLFFAIFVGIMRVSKNPFIRLPTSWVIRVFRGTPLMVQLFVIYYGLSQLEFVRHSWAWTYLRSPYWCALLAFILNSTAYNAHILRGAILAVPHGEIEAGQAFGMSKYKLYRYIILPSALRIGLPAFGNEVIKNMKRTAIASTITINELTGAANLLVSRTLAPYEIFLTAAAFYIALAFVITRAVNWLTKVLSTSAPKVSKTAVEGFAEVRAP